jgi:outer membrane receptor for ferrienterochelin and colicins
MTRARYRWLLLGLCYAPLSHAQSGELEALMEQSIVSTPSKSAESSSTAPATSSIVTAEDLRRHGLRSLDEALNYAALGMVTTSPEHAVEIGARGVLLTGDYGNHVLLLIDGVPANEPWNGTAYFERGAGVPFELIDHIEVTLGPGSVMHGAQAMLGVINVVTKRARNYGGLHLIAEGDASAPVFADGGLRLSPLSRYGAGYRLALGLGREFELFSLPAELTLQLERYRSDAPAWELAPQAWGEDEVTGQPKNFGPRTPPGQWGGLATGTGHTDVPAAYARLRVGELEATARAGMYDRASPYTTSLVNVGDDFDDPDNHERDRWLQLGVAYRRSLSVRLVLAARAYVLFNDYLWFSRRSAAEECPEDLPNGCERTLTGSGSSGGADLRVSLDLPELHGTTMLGIDSRVRHARSDLDVVDRLTGALAPVANDYTRSDGLFAPYLQQAFAPTRWLDANLGVRLDYDTRFGSKLSPRAALGATPWRDGRVKAIYAEAFRGPTAYELNYSDPIEQVPSPSLAAETVRSLELSLEQTAGTHRVFFSAFHSTWSDLVSYRSLSDEELESAVERGQLAGAATSAYTYANSGSLTSTGYSGSFEGSLARRLRYALNLTAAYSRIDLGDGSGPLPLTVGPAVFANARVSYELDGWLPTPALAVRYAGSRPADRAFDGGFATAPYAPPDVQLRGTLSGAVPQLNRLLYRVSATYAASSSGAYVIGPTQYAEDSDARAALSPQRRLSGFVGLEYVLE